MGVNADKQEDKERISISIHLNQVKLLNKEQDERKISTRSKMIRIILDEYFRLHRPEEGMEHLLVKIPGGLLDRSRQLIKRTDADGKKAPLFVDEEDMIREGLRMLIREYSSSR